MRADLHFQGRESHVLLPRSVPVSVSFPYSAFSQPSIHAPRAPLRLNKTTLVDSTTTLAPQYYADTPLYTFVGYHGATSLSTTLPRLHSQQAHLRPRINSYQLKSPLEEADNKPPIVYGWSANRQSRVPTSANHCPI